MTASTTTRRGLFAGAVSLAAAPAIAAGGIALPAGSTPIAALWAKAEALRVSLEMYRGEVAKMAARGTPGWMRLAGPANKLGEARYAALTGIIRSTPRNQGDLAIMAKVALDKDIQQGPRGWAFERLAQATLALAA